MKNIQEILAQFGLTVPENKTADFDKVFKENYKTVAEVGKIETARDNYKAQLETATNALKSFEGVDVTDLKNQIFKLSADLEQQKNDYEAKIADTEFSSLLDSELTAAKAKNLKAVKALLDVDTLKQSKNRTDDIKSAIAEIQKDNEYLFDIGKPQPQISVPGVPAPQQSDAKSYMDGFYANNPFYKK